MDVWWSSLLCSLNEMSCKKWPHLSVSIKRAVNSLSGSTNHSAVFLCTSANPFFVFLFFFYIFQLAERFLKVMNGFCTKHQWKMWSGIGLCLVGLRFLAERLQLLTQSFNIVCLKTDVRGKQKETKGSHPLWHQSDNLETLIVSPWSTWAEKNKTQDLWGYRCW